MESQYSYSTTSSSSSSSLSYRVAVHESSIHGRIPKPTTKKLPIAPFPRTPPRIYKVEAENFKETVQMLTTAPGFQLNNNPRRLQEVAPPPLHLHPRKCDDNNNGSLAPRNVLSVHQIISSAETTTTQMEIPAILSPSILGAGFSPLGFRPLSPSSSLAMWASTLPSPGTLGLFDSWI